MLVFDKAYNYYRQFADWTEEGVYFVCRLKDNTKAEVQEVLFDKLLEKDEYGVYRIEHIHLKYKKEKQEKTLCLRLVYYRDEQGRKYKFITNNWDITAEEVALIYKYRWTIETTFKKLKQNFQLHFFYSDTGEWYKNAGLVHAHSPFVAQCNQGIVQKQESISDRGCTHTDTTDKPFRPDVGSN
jgi:IS4 transposase